MTQRVQDEIDAARPRLVRTDAAAEYVALAVSTLEKLRLSGGGPRFVKLLGGRAVAYDLRDLDAWIDERKASSTSER